MNGEEFTCFWKSLASEKMSFLCLTKLKRVYTAWLQKGRFSIGNLSHLNTEQDLLISNYFYKGQCHADSSNEKFMTAT